MADGNVNDRLRAEILKVLPEPGQMLIGDLHFSRRDETGPRESCFYRPLIGVVVQGFKRSVIAGEEYRYGAGSCLAVGLDLPSVPSIVEASPEKPFLSLSIGLDRLLVTALEAELPPLTTAPVEEQGTFKGVAVGEASPELLDAFLRLAELQGRPERLPVLGPLIIREIHYLLLCGPPGESLRLFSARGTPNGAIIQAVNWLREHYREPLRIRNLAGRVNMAESTFNRHFRRITSLSPLQFQKQLRLYEAHRLLLTVDTSAAGAAFEVGYESPSQFTREYKRFFGETPRCRRMIPRRPLDGGQGQRILQMEGAD